MATPAGRERVEEGSGRNVLLLRTGITFALLASVVSVHFRDPVLLLTRGFQYVYVAVVLSYGWLLIRFAVWGSRDLSRPVAVVQALADVAFVSLLVYATGLFESVFAFMYVVVILLGSIEMHRRGAMLWAALSAAAYSGLLYLQMEGAVSPPGSEEARLGWSQILGPMLTNAVGFLLTGALAGLLGEDVRKTRRRVQDQEDHLRKLETFNKYVVDNIPSGILTTDNRGRVGLVNEAACQILAVRRDDVIGRPLDESLARAVEAPRGPYSRARAEIAYRRPGGDEIFLGYSTSSLRDAEGQVIGCVLIFQDLTPVKRMEERVRLADRLAGVGELAAGLAHEIRNPLASVAGSSQMLRDAAGIPPESLPLLEIIERESTRLNGLIADFLAFAGPSRRNVKPVALAEALGKVVEAVRAGEARDRGVDVETGAMPDLVVEGDAEQLRQVVWNLLRNAIEATPPGGRVRVDLVAEVRHGERFAVGTVRDTGQGIDPAILGRIFNPFFTSKERGTGLGLSISQRIVHDHGGFIEVQSASGRGSVFSVYLPLARDTVHAGAMAS